jgi:hypothetical protein
VAVCHVRPGRRMPCVLGCKLHQVPVPRGLLGVPTYLPPSLSDRRTPTTYDRHRHGVKEACSAAMVESTRKRVCLPIPLKQSTQTRALTLEPLRFLVSTSTHAEAGKLSGSSAHWQWQRPSPPFSILSLSCAASTVALTEAIKCHDSEGGPEKQMLEQARGVVCADLSGELEATDTCQCAGGPCTRTTSTGLQTTPSASGPPGSRDVPRDVTVT